SDNHGGAVEVGVLELARALPRARGQVHVDEGGLARGLGVAVGGREHDRLREEENRLDAGHGQERIEESGLRAAGVGEGIANILSQQLMDQELPARPEYALLLHLSLLVEAASFGSRQRSGSKWCVDSRATGSPARLTSAAGRQSPSAHR